MPRYAQHISRRKLSALILACVWVVTLVMAAPQVRPAEPSGRTNAPSGYAEARRAGHRLPERPRVAPALAAFADRYRLSATELRAVNGLASERYDYAAEHSARVPIDPMTGVLAVRREPVRQLVAARAAESSQPVEAPPVEAPSVLAAPGAARLPQVKHEYQRWNNCGPATALMALSAHGVHVAQADLAALLKPNGRDVNVSPHEIAHVVQPYGVNGLVRVNGSVERMKALIAAGVAVVAEQWIEPPGLGGMGHYRMVSAYDDDAQAFVVQDSYFGPNRRISYAEFDRAWEVFNRLYIAIYRPDQQATVEVVLGEHMDVQTANSLALAVLEQRTAEQPGNAWAWHSLGDMRLASENPSRAVEAYERAIGIGLPPRMFWYQFGVFEALAQVGNYQRILDLSTAVLSHEPNIEELHYWQGLAYQSLGQPEQAAEAYRRSLARHPGYSPAAQRLAGLGQ
jgi:hypothetical protein